MVEQTGVKHSTGKGYWFCGTFFCWDSNITDCFFEPILVGVDPIHQISIFLIIACQVIFGQGHHGCSFMFSMVQYLVQLCLMRNTENLSQCDWALLSNFPVDLWPAQKVFLLERQSTIIAICPKHSCQQCHKPTFNPGSPIPVYSKHCLGHHFGKPCKQELLCPKEIQGNIIFMPLKPFVYFKGLVGWPIVGTWFRSKDGCCMVQNYRTVWDHVRHLRWGNALKLQGAWP